MSAVETGPHKLTKTEKLALAQEAFNRYKAQCFWFFQGDFQVTEESLPVVIRGLRSDGDRAAFLIAAKLCQ